MVERITSHQNPRVKLIKRLRDKKDRDREGLFVVDYERDLERALACGYEVAFALVSPAGAHLPVIAQVATERVYEVTPDILEKVSYRANPSPVVAVLHQRPARTASDLKPEDVRSPVLALVNLQKPGNIGALLRTADASGFGSVFLIDTALDRYNPNLIRSSTGACFLDNLYELDSASALEFFRRGQYLTVAAHLAGDKNLYDVDFPPRTAVVLGTEDRGLPAHWADACDLLVKIPMIGSMTDSLNVSVSGAVFMYEVLRQSTGRDS